MNIRQALFNFFEVAETVSTQVVLVHYNSKYRKVQLAFLLPFKKVIEDQKWKWMFVENEWNDLLQHGNDPLAWQEQLDQVDSFTHPFSYYERNGKKQYTCSLKVPNKLIPEIEKLKKGSKMEVQFVLHTYTGYPVPDQNGVYFEWIV